VQRWRRRVTALENLSGGACGEASGRGTADQWINTASAPI
jgi:hypothetical protein